MAVVCGHAAYTFKPGPVTLLTHYQGGAEAIKICFKATNALSALFLCSGKKSERKRA